MVDKLELELLSIAAPGRLSRSKLRAESGGSADGDFAW